MARHRGPSDSSSWNGIVLVAAAILLACSAEEERTVAAPIAEDTLQGLTALGYTEWAEGEAPGNRERRGVTLHDAERAAPGTNVFKLSRQRQAFLMDLDGRVLHEWAQPDGEGRSWHHFEILPDGHLLGLAKQTHIERVDWESKLLWRTPLEVHHDLDIDAEGRILALADRSATIELADGRAIPIVDNEIVILDADDGRILERVSLLPLLGARVPSQRLRAIEKDDRHLGSKREKRKALDLRDVFHTNSIEILRQDLPGVAAAGDVLLSIRELDLVAIVALDPLDIVWSWGPGELQRQHDASVLPGGNLLIFDNRPDSAASRIVELDPQRGEIVWEFRGSPARPFRTGKRGSSQRLPNGNILVGESARGHAFEITRAGDVVWDYWIPEVHPDTGKRRAFYRFRRLPPGYFEPGLLDPTAPDDDRARP